MRYISLLIFFTVFSYPLYAAPENKLAFLRIQLEGSCANLTETERSTEHITLGAFRLDQFLGSALRSRQINDESLSPLEREILAALLRLTPYHSGEDAGNALTAEQIASGLKVSVSAVLSTAETLRLKIEKAFEPALPARLNPEELAILSAIPATRLLNKHRGADVTDHDLQEAETLLRFQHATTSHPWEVGMPSSAYASLHAGELFLLGKLVVRVSHWVTSNSREEGAGEGLEIVSGKIIRIIGITNNVGHIWFDADIVTASGEKRVLHITHPDTLRVFNSGERTLFETAQLSEAELVTARIIPAPLRQQQRALLRGSNTLREMSLFARDLRVELLRGPLRGRTVPTTLSEPDQRAKELVGRFVAGIHVSAPFSASDENEPAAETIVAETVVGRVIRAEAFNFTNTFSDTPIGPYFTLVLLTSTGVREVTLSHTVGDSGLVIDPKTP